MSAHFLGIDIGGTKCAACLGDSAGRLIESVTILTQKGDSGWKSTTDRLVSTARELADKHGAEKIVGIGVSCGSPLDSQKGLIQEPANLPGWKDVPILALLRDEFPDAEAWLENDANAGALAELTFGAGRSTGARHLLFLTFGTGLGAGLVLNGQLYSGANGYAGEIGHIRLAPYGPSGCGKPGSFEGFCSGGGIQQLAITERRAWFDTTTLPQDGFDTRDVAEGAVAGDALCRKILETSGDYLGRGLAVILDVLNPELIVIGSVFTRCEEFLRPPMTRSLEREARSETVSVCKIVPAALGEDIGNYAALSIAYYRSGRLDQLRRDLAT